MRSPAPVADVASSVPPSPSADLAVVRALARIEARWLLRHPALRAGVAATLVMFAANHRWPWSSDAYLLLAGLGVGGLAPFTLVAANAAVLRGRRHGAADLLRSLPRPPGATEAAQLAALWWVVGIAAVLAVTAPGFYYYADISVPRLPSLAEVAQGPAVVACAGVLGVLVARWVPSLAAGVVAAVGGAAWQLVAHGLDGSARWFAPVVDLQIVDRSGDTLGYLEGSMAWHVAALGGLVLLGVGTTLRRSRRDRPLPAATALVGMGLSVVGAVLQLP